jgi:alpha-beta hydrolase superfamily lysophospholipase
MSEAPTLVLVYGARHQHVATVDQRAGRYRRPHGAAAVQRAVPIPQLGDMYDDARTISAAVQAIDGPVVVCAHSYGGVPTSLFLIRCSGVTRRAIQMTPPLA